MFFYSGRQAVVSEPQTLRGIRVLLVDESRFVRRLFTMMLGELGAVVTVAGDGSEAIRIVGAGRTFDVVIVDSLLPSVDGAELCDDLCTISSGATKPIVVLYTGSLRRYQLRHGRIPRSVDAFVLKDASGDGLVQKISQLLDARSARVSSPAIAAEV
jgi:CheY-like chemotaxis protein